MTVYFKRIFTTLAQHFTVQLDEHFWGRQLASDSNIVIDCHSCLSPEEFPGHRITHIIRDPRDLLVSAYYYHLRTTEAWCTVPGQSRASIPESISYQQHLRSLNLEQGLLFELNNVTGGEIDKMANWDYTHQHVLELRYEDVLGDEAAQFRKIFKWYGWRGKLYRIAMKVAKEYSRSNVKQQSKKRKHMRSNSRIGQWRDHFSDPVITEFKAKHGNALIKLGYADDLDW